MFQKISNGWEGRTHHYTQEQLGMACSARVHSPACNVENQ